MRRKAWPELRQREEMGKEREGGREKGSRCERIVKKCVKTKVVDECDSTMGCDEHDYQPPCPNNTVDALKLCGKPLVYLKVTRAILVFIREIAFPLLHALLNFYTPVQPTVVTKSLIQLQSSDEKYSGVKSSNQLINWPMLNPEQVRQYFEMWMRQSRAED
ncbi:hypothetical protein RND71_007703 [Anisodus tanguticus]|uniref:Uncharacterized protein n=1 Tax=Anisodus tanguticus TaxID=243964 RepID=A0AAE1SMB2_9SOLA|nr:hypothetical protein RND71_007703 [Anisodus tanguticus]